MGGVAVTKTDRNLSDAEQGEVKKYMNDACRWIGGTWPALTEEGRT
jgi:hypothetical protein